MADHRSIYDFNAAGDGVTDDAGALQDAIDTAVAGGGGRVWCGGPDKTVLISAPIILGSLVELYGGATIKVDAANWSGGYQEPVFSNDNYDATEITDHGIGFTGLTFDGSGVGGAAHMIRLRMVRDVRVTDCLFKDVDNGTAFLATEDTWVDRCKVVGALNCGIDHWDGAKGAHVTNCIVDGSSAQGIQFTGTGTANEDRTSEDFVCIGNTVRNVRASGGGSGIIVNANDGGSGVALARIIGNLVEDSDIPYAVTGSGNGFIVSGNIAKNCLNTGFLAAADGGNHPSGISLIGHRVINCTSYGSAPILIGGGSGHVLSACSVEGGSYAYAIDMSGASDWTIDGGRLQAGSVGKVNIGSATAYKLDGVEFGTWTPYLRFGGSTAGIAYTRQQGIWTKSGRNVRVVGEILLSSKGTATGVASIAGLPFDGISWGAGPQYQAAGGVAAYDGMTGLGYPPALINVLGELYLYIYSATTTGNMQSGNFTNTSRLRFEAAYIAAE